MLIFIFYIFLFIMLTKDTPVVTWNDNYFDNIINIIINYIVSGN